MYLNDACETLAVFSSITPTDEHECSLSYLFDYLDGGVKMSDFSLHPYDLTFPWLLKVGRNDAFGMVQ